MDKSELESRLSRISTKWTLFDQAHGSPPDARQVALAALIQRYQGAAYRYILGAVHNPDVADELFQEFAFRLARGAFRSVDPNRGRFRDYLKSTLYHLIVDFQKQQRKAHRPLNDQVVEPVASEWDLDQSEARFAESWRDEMLARAWSVLSAAEQAGGPPHFSVLKFRSDHPAASSAEMAAGLTQQLHPDHPFTDTGIRKTLQRARAHFAEILVDEVARSLHNPSDDELEAELIAVGLLPYCRTALQQRQQAAGKHS